MKIYSVFLPGIGKHFFGKVLCSSEDFVRQPIRILHFFVMNSVLRNPQFKIERNVIWRTRGPGNWSPCPLMFCAVRCFAYSFIILGRRTAWRRILWQDTSLSDVCPFASHICKTVLVGSGAPDYARVEPGCRITALSLTERSPLSASRKTSLQLKQKETELS